MGVNHINLLVPPSWYHKQEEGLSCKCGATEEVQLVELCGYYWVSCEWCGKVTKSYESKQEALEEWVKLNA